MTQTQQSRSIVPVIIACALCVALIATLAYAAPVAASSDEALLAMTGVSAQQKSENVRVSMDANGTIKETTVETTLKNSESGQYLEDVSSLAGIKGDDGQEFAKKDSRVIWVANGKDVSYTGKTDEAAPIEVTIAYKLDGKSVTAEELAGKTGNVSITYSFKNNASALRNINGSVERMYTPFIVMTGMMLDTHVFTNVQAENARLVENDDNLIVIGMTMPGLKDSLGLDDGSVDIPESFTITAHAEGFKLNSTLTMATTGLFDDIDSSAFDFSELTSGIAELRASFASAIEGSQSLTDGLTDLEKGMEQLSAGTSYLPSNMSALAQGSSLMTEALRTLVGSPEDETDSLYALRNGSALISESLTTISKDIDELADAIKALEDLQSLLDEIDNQDVRDAIELIQNAELSVQDLIDALVNAAGSLPEVEQNINELSDAISQSDALEATSLMAQAADSAEAAQEGLSSVDLSGIDAARASLTVALAGLEEGTEAYSAVSNALAALDAIDASAIDAALASAAQAEEQARQASSLLANLDSALESLSSQLDSTRSLVASANEKVMVAQDAESDDADALLDDAVERLTRVLEAYERLSDDIEVLSGKPMDEDPVLAIKDSISLVAQGTAAITDGLDAIIDALNAQIIPGSEKVASGMTELSDAMPALAEGASVLSTGTQLAAEGSQDLTDGLRRFDSEGLAGLQSGINNKLEDIKQRIDALSEMSRSCTNCAGISDGAEGTVRFVFEVDAIEADE